MESNIKKIKDLLEKGFFITQISEVFAKDGQNCNEVTVNLKKGRKKNVVKSDNSQEFSTYISHFRQVKNQYDNYVFEYIEDLERFHNQVNFQPGNVPLKNQHIIKISGRVFSKGILTLGIFKTKGPGIKTIGEFWIYLDENPDFHYVDFSDEIEVLDKSEKLILKGYVKNYNFSKKVGILTIQDFSIEADTDRITFEAKNMNSVDDLLSIVTGVAKFGLNINGQQPKTIIEDYIVIVPMINLIVNDSFTIGNVEFYQEFCSKDDQLIRSSNNGRRNPLWNGNFPRAKVVIRAPNFYQALMSGYKEISKAVDLISFRNNLSFPSLKVGSKLHNSRFSYYKYFSRVSIPTWVYCRRKNSNAHTLINIEPLNENVLSLDIDPQEYFSEINELCGELISKIELSNSEENLLQALHWLGKSIQDGNNKDKFLGLWVAFEFLISGTKTEKLFSKPDISKLKSLIDTIDFDENQKAAIKSKINMLNDSPLMAKFNVMIKNLDIEISEDELIIFKAARDCRRELIHGLNDVEIDDKILNKMRTILEKIFVGKINSLKAERETKIEFSSI